MVNSNLKSYGEADLGNIIPSLTKLAIEQPNTTWPETGTDRIGIRVMPVI